MTAQAILELEEWLGVRLMAIRTGEGHGCPLGERLPFHLHGRMAGQAGLPLGENFGLAGGQEVMTRQTVQACHAADIGLSGAVTLLTGLDCGLDGVQRRQVTGETWQVGAHDVNLVARCRRDLRPSSIMAQVAALADLTIELGVGRDVLGIMDRPMPDNAGAIDNILLMTHMAGDLMMRTRLPGLPSGFHDVATATECRFMFDIDIEPIASIGQADDTNGGGSQEDD